MKVIKSLVDQAAVSNFLLEDHIRVTPARLAEIQSQLSVDEVTVRILEPMDFKTITADATTLKQFMDGLAWPT